MEFEDILQDVGGFGPYQIFLVTVFLIPYCMVHSWFFLNMIFNSSTPDHWCFVPEVSGSNLTLDAQKLLIRPPQDPRCLTYDVDFSRILQSGNRTVDVGWPTRQCTDGWQYDRTDYDATASTRWNLVCGDSQYSSIAVSLTFFGNLCGAPVYSFLSDRVGRKPIIFTLAALVAATEMGSTLSPHFALFLVLRAVNGTAMTTVYASGYIILLELVSPNIRGRINVLATTGWTIGLSLLPLLAWLARDWVTLSIVTSSVAAGLLLYWRLLPESPRWLISRKRYDEAHAILSKISQRNGRTAHQGNQLMQKIEKVGERIQKENSSVADSPLDLLKYPTLRKRFILITLCWAGNSIPYYGLQVNVKNLSGNQFLNFFLMSVVEIPSHFAGWACMDRLGRRWCSVTVFLITTTACLLPIALPSGSGSVGLAASLLAKSSSSVAFMTVYQQCPELMPTSLRGVAVGLSGTIGTSAALLAPYIVYLAKFGASVPFLVFSAVAFASALCASFLPETLDKNLPQTVADSENFEKNFQFFSCGSSEEPQGDSEREHSSRMSPAPDIPSSRQKEDVKAMSNIPEMIKSNSVRPEYCAKYTPKTEFCPSSDGRPYSL